MIGGLAQVFVERRAPRVQAASAGERVRLLVVDATRHRARMIELFERLETAAPIRVSLVALDELASLPELVSFDVVWVVAGDSSDAAYCTLVSGELAQRFTRARHGVFTVGGRAGDGPSIELAALTEVLPWRRRRVIDACAAGLAVQLVDGSGAS